MNSLERIQATLAGSVVDRRPVMPVLSLYGARLTGCPLSRYYADAQSYVNGQLAVQEVFQPDALFAPFSFASLGAAFGSELHYFADQAPNVRRPAVATAEQLEALVFPTIEKEPHIQYLLAAVRLMVAQCRKELAVAAVLPAPTDLPVLVMGIESWMETVLFDRAGAQRVLERVRPFFVALANALFEQGATFLALPCGFCSPSVATREMVENFSRPALVDALSQVKGPVVIHHAGAPILAHLDLLTGLPSTIAFALDHRDDLSKARQIVGDTPALLSGPSGPNLAWPSPATIQEECRAKLIDRRQDRHFALVTAGADIPLCTAPENIQALFRAVSTWEGSVA